MSESITPLKVCTTCKQAKPLEDFARQAAKQDGRRERCKACTSAHLRKRYAEDPEFRRRQLEANRAARARNIERYREHVRAWQRRNPEVLKRIQRENYGTPEVKARRLVSQAIKYHGLQKPSNCQRCGKECTEWWELHAHHADYSKPLDVEWLCTTCHGAERRRYD